MAKVYSYIRFSSKKQERGESIRRQREAGQRWMDRHSQHTLDTTLKLRDLGVSAFRGKNKNTGALGKFIQCVQNGTVPKGSILMLENLDRFSREQAFDAATVFNALVKAGIAILVLDPEQLIDESNIGKMEVVMPTIISMLLSNEESRKKSERSIFNWQKRRESARNEGKPIAGHCPAWLRCIKKGKKVDHFEKKPEGVEAIKYIFQRSADGVGQRTLCHEMNASEFKPCGYSKQWNETYIRHVLRNRVVLGEFQPMRLDASGKRVPDGPPIKDYFPAVIEQGLFDRAQAACKQRYRERGPSGKFVNLFSGIIFGKDGHPVHVETGHCRKPSGKVFIQRRLVSHGHTTRGTDKKGTKRVRDQKACSIGMNYNAVERAVLANLIELKASQLKTSTVPQATVEHRLQELAGIDQRMLQLDKALLDTTDAAPDIPQLRSAIAELRQRRNDVQVEIDAMRQTQAAAGQEPLGEFKDILVYIGGKPAEEQHELRLRLRTLIGQMVEGIRLDPFKIGHRSVCHIDMQLKPGGYRRIEFVGHPTKEYVRSSLDETLRSEDQAAMNAKLERRGQRPSWVETPWGAVPKRPRTEDERKQDAKLFKKIATAAKSKAAVQERRKLGIRLPEEMGDKSPRKITTPDSLEGKGKTRPTTTAKPKTKKPVTTDAVVLVEAKTAKATKPTRKAKKSPKAKR